MKSYIQPTDDKIRSKNLQRYIDENFDGNVSAFGRFLNERMEFSPAQSRNLSQSLKGAIPFGKDKALQIETALGFALGTLSKANCQFPALSKNEYINIPVYENDAAAGRLNHLFEEDNLLDEPIRIPKPFLLKQGANPATVVGLIAKGKSMQDRISDGAIVFIDRSQRNLISGEVYCFLTNKNKRQIKYLIEGINGIIVKSHNPDFPDEIVPYNSDIELEIDGRVVFVLNPF